MTARLPDKQIIILVLLGGVSDMKRRLHCVDRRAGSRASWRSCNGLVTMLLLRPPVSTYDSTRFRMSICREICNLGKVPWPEGRSYAAIEERGTARLGEIIWSHRFKVPTAHLPPPANM